MYTERGNMQRYSRYSQMQHVKEDVVDEGVKKVDHNACDYLRPYDALKEERHIYY